MPHKQPVDVLGHLQDKTVDIRKRPVIAGDLARDKGAHAAEAREVEPLWLVEDKPGDPVGEAAAEIAPVGVPLLVVIGVDDLMAALLRVGEEALDLLRRVLQIVVHRDDVGARRVAQPGHHRVVLAVIARQVDEGDRHARPLD